MSDKVMGFTGISFPFRISSKGGVEMSTTSATNSEHIVEAIQQILLTKPRERCMEYHFKSDLDTSIFEPHDRSAEELVKYQIKQALQSLEDRIELVSINVYSVDTTINADITFKVIKYNTTVNSTVKVGEMSNE